MAKVFTITPGLENLGAMKSGGQGSVYKARRTGQIISAVKILPTPIFSEAGDDKNYTDFTNEVTKLRKVNEEPNPHVVTILNHGLTESGSFPYIEMEFIEGPDLEELLKPPHQKIFSVRNCIKVAEQLSSALAHCHRVGVKHGDVKSNNVKYSKKTGNYVLLDFGLAVLSDEQRRTSLRRAGAVEFMAPEQTDGVLLFESDVYGFGVILFELVAGVVPFPLTGNSDSERNQVLLAHRESRLPDIKELRKQHATDLDTKHVPDWLVDTIYKCLAKSPGQRFKSGVELHDHICHHTFGTSVGNNEMAEEYERMKAEVESLRSLRSLRPRGLAEPVQQPNIIKKKRSTLPLAVLGILAVIALLVMFVFGVFNAKNPVSAAGPVKPKPIIAQYQVAAAQAFFYKEANVSEKLDGYLIPSKAVIPALSEKNGFIYTEFANDNNKTAKGWLKKSDLRTMEGRLTSSKSGNVQLKESDVAAQLQRAHGLATTGQIQAAMYIYDGLAEQDVPEAMYEFGNYTVRNSESKTDCRRGIALLRRAAERGYTPAKRTLGILYGFAGNAQQLQDLGYTNCSVTADAKKGAALLIEATLEGDTTAKRWLSALNRQ